MLKILLRLMILCWVSLLILLFSTQMIGQLQAIPLLAYLSDVNSSSDIMLADVQQGLTLNISHSQGGEDMLLWSADGRYLAFRSYPQFFVLDTQSWQIRELASVNRNHYFWWLNLNEIVFTDSYSQESTVIHAETGESRERMPEDECPEYCSFAGSFIRPLKQVETSLVGDEIHVEVYEITPEELIGTSVNFNDLPVWSSDGEYFIFRSFLQGQRDIYMSPAEGGIARRLTNSEKHETMLGWSHDRQWLSYTIFIEARLDVFVMNLETMETYNLSHYERPDYEPVWQPVLPEGE